MRPKFLNACNYCLILLAGLFLLSFHFRQNPPDETLGDVKYSILEPGAFLPTHPGWVLMRGQQVDSTPLKDLGIHVLPDARAMFIRGMNVSRTDQYADPQPGRDIVTAQECAVQKHYHNTQGWSQEASGGHGFGGSGFWGNSNQNPGTHKFYPTVADDPAIPSRETRPNNIALYIYVKIK